MYFAVRVHVLTSCDFVYIVKLVCMHLAMVSLLYCQPHTHTHTHAVRKYPMRLRWSMYVILINVHTHTSLNVHIFISPLSLSLSLSLSLPPSVFSPGEDARYWYAVVSGTVKMFNVDPNDSTKVSS